MHIPRYTICYERRCFTRLVSWFQFESQTSFGSHYKTRIEGDSMFCDFYNAQQRTYCKRLKVLCPEHLKEPKVTVALSRECSLAVAVIVLNFYINRWKQQLALEPCYSPFTSAYVALHVIVN